MPGPPDVYTQLQQAAAPLISADTTPALTVVCTREETLDTHWSLALVMGHGDHGVKWGDSMSDLMRMRHKLNECMLLYSCEVVSLNNRDVKYDTTSLIAN